MSNQASPQIDEARGSVLALLFFLAIAGCNGPRQISQSGSGAYEASLAPLAGGFAVAWYDTRDGNPEIYVRLLDSEGRPQSPEIRLTNTSEFSYEADIEAAEGNLAVAWYEKSATGMLKARLGLWNRSGEVLWVKNVSAARRNGRNTLVRVKGREIFCAWIEDDTGENAGVWAGWWDLEGRTVASPRRLAPAGETTWNLNAALDGDGRAWVAFDSKAGTRNDEIFLARVEKTSSEVVRLRDSRVTARRRGSPRFSRGWTVLH